MNFLFFESDLNKIAFWIITVFDKIFYVTLLILETVFAGEISITLDYPFGSRMPLIGWFAYALFQNNGLKNKVCLKFWCLKFIFLSAQITCIRFLIKSRGWIHSEDPNPATAPRIKLPPAALSRFINFSLFSNFCISKVK